MVQEGDLEKRLRGFSIGSGGETLSKASEKKYVKRRDRSAWSPLCSRNRRRETTLVTPAVSVIGNKRVVWTTGAKGGGYAKGRTLRWADWKSYKVPAMRDINSKKNGQILSWGPSGGTRGHNV